MKTRLLTFLLCVLSVGHTSAAIYSLFLIETDSSILKEESEVELNALLRKGASIKVFVQTNGTSSTENPGTVQTHTIPYVKEYDELGNPKVYGEGDVGTRFRVIEEGETASIEFSHSTLEGWMAYTSAEYLLPVFSTHATNTTTNFRENTAVILSALSSSATQDGNPPKKMITLIVVAKGSLENIRLELGNLFPVASNNEDKSLHTGPKIIGPGMILQRASSETPEQ